MLLALGGDGQGAAKRSPVPRTAPAITAISEAKKPLPAGPTDLQQRMPESPRWGGWDPERQENRRRRVKVGFSTTRGASTAQERNPGLESRRDQKQLY